MNTERTFRRSIYWCLPAVLLFAACTIDDSLTALKWKKEFQAPPPPKSEAVSFMAQIDLDAVASARRRPATRHAESVRAALPACDFPKDGIFSMEEGFDLDLSGAKLDEALNLVAQTGGINLLFQGDFSDPVEMAFTDTRLDDAFRILLESYDCSVEKKGGAYLVIRYSQKDPWQHVFQLRHISTEAVRADVESLLGSAQSLVATPDGCAFMVNAPPEFLERVARFLDTVDRPEKQVVIETRIFELLLSDRLELGTELNFRNISISDSTSQILSSFLPNFGAGQNQAIVTFTGDKAAIDASFRVLRTLTRLEILARPKIFMKNGEEAKIEVIEEVPYIQATTTTTGSTESVGIATVEQVEFKEVGLRLTVTPYIKGDNSVELKIFQDASQQVGTFNDVPVVDHRVVDTRLVVRNGEAIVIGGLIKTEQSEVVRGIPFLMDIPLLGYLFKYREHIKEKRELIIMLSPTVVDMGPPAAPEKDLRTGAAKDAPRGA